MKSFRLAPMSALMWILTVPLLGLPFLFLWFGRLDPTAVMLGVAWFLIALYASVWLFWRPSRFQVARGTVRVVFPLRRKVFHGITRAHFIEEATGLREHLGFAMRVGVGGLWGAFGGLWSRRAGMIAMYISTTKNLVLLESNGTPVLLVSPEDPQEFAAHVVGANA
jgi:hypothetical protein